MNGNLSVCLFLRSAATYQLHAITVDLSFSGHSKTKRSKQVSPELFYMTLICIPVDIDKGFSIIDRNRILQMHNCGGQLLSWLAVFKFFAQMNNYANVSCSR
ncbi:hypothetical protein T4A_12669 [Trichinella pseudospiralis]|uniref:Uncharacterized protein n=1 Tax=Trichinella pseudospiralis TaxID=6337 RepID=A0A0V1E0R6_TRIPS|nr:hypothetical protein T4A_12669 [Trichinella pseudospiralis]KRZ29332.1 hypothetical protein T4C_4600 [Trichinella pseudospiralis]